MNVNTLIIQRLNLFEKRHLASRIACLFFIAFNFFWQVESYGFSGINYFALAGIIIFSFQFIFQFEALNGTLGGLSFLLSVYFAISIFSEFLEFSVPSNDAYLLLKAGLAFSLGGIIWAIFMLREFIRDF